MALSVFDLFSVGIGPSSSHTVGPMRAARKFVGQLHESGRLPELASLRCELFGSLGATGHGHGSPDAVILGLLGETPEHTDPEAMATELAEIRSSGQLSVLRQRRIPFRIDEDLIMHRRESLPGHPNGMRFTAHATSGEEITRRTYFSIGGGFVVNGATDGTVTVEEDATPVPFPFRSGIHLLRHTTATGKSIADVVMANEEVWRPRAEVRAGLLSIWAQMRDCVSRGLRSSEAQLPGGLKVPRRAPETYRQLMSEDHDDHLRAMDWIALYALAVNEENAAGGRVVTAPTNGAAGIIPAVLHYFVQYYPDATDDAIVEFLLTAGAVGMIFKQTASISGAEVGCQGEVGSACSMAAAGLTAVLGGSPEQVENAAEIGLEHNLGLTCDPIGGLVQIPCIERNAVAAVKAVTAARTAMRGNGEHIVSLDKVIKTMKETGADMSVKYKETARGGLAVNVIEC